MALQHRFIVAIRRSALCDITAVPQLVLKGEHRFRHLFLTSEISAFYKILIRTHH
jgi:hypothetical protein